MTSGSEAKRILWVLPYLPWPITSGGKSRQYHLMKCLAGKGHQITLLVQSKVAADDQILNALSFLEEVIVLPRRKVLSIKTLLGAVFSRYPLLTCVNGFNPALSSKFEQLLSQKWDVIQIEHSYCFQPYADILQVKNIPFILTEHNVESGLGAATYDRLPSIMQFYASFDRRKYRSWEKEVMQLAEYVIAVTKEDAVELSAISERRIEVVINGVDTKQFKEVSANMDEHRILFVGNYEYAPNVDAVEWLMNEVMPQVWKESPEAKVLICGYAMPETWATQWPDSRIEWTGYVLDLKEVQSKSTVFLAALRSGGGSKLKVLEAMAAGLPLVSTAQGVSGLNVKQGVHYLGGDSASSLAQALCLILNNPNDAEQLALAARNYVNSNNDWAAAAEQLESVYEMLPK